MTLGCASEYTAIITARDCETYAASVSWSSLEWSRVLDEVSTASIRIPDALGGLRCNIELGDALVPWRYGLRIERDGQEVWAGPITNISRSARTSDADDFVTINAMDKLAWTMKRTPTQDLSFEDVDAGTIFKTVLDDAMSFDNIPGLYCPDFLTGYAMTRDVLALNFEYQYDTLSDLAKSAVDFFMLGGRLCVQNQDSTGFPAGWYYQDGEDGPRRRIAQTPDPYGRYFFGLFTDEAWISRPGFDINGMAQGNDVFVPGTDSGEAGFRRYWVASDVDLLDGLLTYVDVNPLYRPNADEIITSDAVFQQRADSILALRKAAPVVLSGGSLAQDSPISIDTLFPGSIWAVDLAEHGLSQLLTTQRLKRVDVSVTKSADGLVEQVSPTLIPLGTDESEGG